MGWFNDTFGFDIPGITGPGSVTDAFFGDNGLFSNPEGAWDNFKNGQTNEANERIANENLDYQRERNEIEDARYAEETAYNRAFAQDERNYQRAFAEEQRNYDRALQQQIFNREDTALERQASSLSSMGINPLSQNMNGLGAGQVIQSNGPASTVAPSLSSRGGQALHNDFQMQDKGVFQSLSPLLSLADTLNGYQTGEFQRDALALQNDRQYLENLDLANQLGIVYKGYMPDRTKDKNYRTSHLDFYHTEKDGSEKLLWDTDEFNKAAYSKYKNQYFGLMPDWAKTLNFAGDDNVYKDAEKALTKMSKLWSNGFENLFSKDGAQSFYDLGKDKNNKFNPFNFLLNVFGF